MIPMLGRELIERKQCLAILGQALDRLVVFRSVFLGEDVIATSAEARFGAK